MNMRAVSWENDSIRIIDQTKLPSRLEYINIKDLQSLWKAIKELKVRGAPALGAAAALGVYLGIRKSKAERFEAFARELDRVIRYIGSSRPTARNLFWGLERMGSIAVKNRHSPVKYIKDLLFKEALCIIEEERQTCRKIAGYGQRFIKENDSILTICNTGILATIDYGTALGVLYRAKELGKKFKVYACETRPLLQGARLTTWELKQNNIDVTLICDSMAASLMRQGKIDKVITGADRITKNADVANKIGTYSLAVLSAYHKIPFYVAAPFSTFDLSIEKADKIPIEERDPAEVTDMFFKRPMAAKGVKVYNPAFDVTEGRLITAVITDRGVLVPAYRKNIEKLRKKR